MMVIACIRNCLALVSQSAIVISGSGGYTAYTVDKPT